MIEFGGSYFEIGAEGEWRKRGRTSGDWYVADDDESAMLDEILRWEELLSNTLMFQAHYDQHPDVRGGSEESSI